LGRLFFKGRLGRFLANPAASVLKFSQFFEINAREKEERWRLAAGSWD
jgi:hypothetical protein